jgi:ABC-type transport system involved in multi-copper enzyme maturation permease subunit
MNKKLRINPILKKDMMVGSRSMKMTWGIMVLNLIFALIVSIMLLDNANTVSFSSNYYKELLAVFPVMAVGEAVIMCLVIPIMTSGTISGERERQTLDIMLTTPIKPMSIITGKLASAIMTMMMYVLSTIPIMAIAFVLGGLDWWVLFAYIGMMLYLGIYVGSIGIFSSSIKKTSIGATITSIVIIAAIVIGTFIIYLVGFWVYDYSKYGSTTNNVDIFNLTTTVLMFNPVVPFFDFMLRSCGAESIYVLGKYTIATQRMYGYMEFLYKYCIAVSIPLNLIVSYGFMRLAARRTVVARKRKRRNKTAMSQR